MNNATITKTDGVSQFRLGVDELLQKREYFKSRILPMLVENRDFYTIKGRKSLGKAGGEKIASIYGFSASFKKDAETLESFHSIDGLVAYVCSLSRNGIIIGEGRGAAQLKNNGNDPNKTLKMAQKSAYLDSVIRSTGLSDIFTQDLEDMPLESIQAGDESNPNDIPHEPAEDSGGYDDRISLKQKKFLDDLAYDHIEDEGERDRFLANLDSFSRNDASDAIQNFLSATGR